jgi:hypothetical protein
MALKRFVLYVAGIALFAALTCGFCILPVGIQLRDIATRPAPERV